MLQSIAPFPPGIHLDVPLAVISTVISTVLAGPALHGSFFIPLMIPWLLQGLFSTSSSDRSCLSAPQMFYMEKEPPVSWEQGREARVGWDNYAQGFSHMDEAPQAHREVINQR